MTLALLQGVACSSAAQVRLQAYSEWVFMMFWRASTWFATAQKLRSSLPDAAHATLQNLSATLWSASCMCTAHSASSLQWQAAVQMGQSAHY